MKTNEFNKAVYKSLIGLCIFLFGFFLSKAQTPSACKTKLDGYNQSVASGKDLQTGQLKDMESCLSSIEAEYDRLLKSEQENLRKTEVQVSAVNANKNDLERAKAQKDSLSIEALKKKEIELNRELDRLKMTSVKRDIDAYKGTLIKSYTKLIEYYQPLDDPKVPEYNRKLANIQRAVF
jgi:hypothetical protein